MRWMTYSFILISLFLAFSSFAQTKIPQKKVVSDSGQRATVVVDGAAVYEKPNFDSPVMDYLDRDRPIVVSRRLYKGVGGLGAFYKIRLRPGVFGYITDVDIKTSGRPLTATQAPRASQKRTPQKPSEVASQSSTSTQDSNLDPTQIDPELESEKVIEPEGQGIYLTRYLSFNIVQFSYAEEIAKKSQSGSLTMIGVRKTGPGKVLGGFPLDLEVNFTTEAPDFYDKYFSSSKGFKFLGHSMLVLPALETKKGLIYYGFGLVYRYSKYDLKLKSQPGKQAIDSQEFAMGLGAQAGYAHSVGSRYVVRGDLRYYFEKESYWGFALSGGLKF